MRSPMRRLYFCRAYIMMSSSISSPATRMERATTMPPRRKDGHFGRAAANVHDHAAARFDHRQAYADGGRHWLFDQIRFARPRADRRVVHRALFHFRHAAGDADHHTRARDGQEHLVVRLFDEIVQHRLRDFELGDDAIAQRP